MIIGLSGHKQVGKDTIAAIIRLLIAIDKKPTAFYGTKQLPIESYPQVVEGIKNNGESISGWQRKLFADKLKDIVCILIGCTREQLEDNDFKERPLVEEWRRWAVANIDMIGSTLNPTGVVSPFFSSKKEAEEWNKYSPDLKICSNILTPRLLLQLIGTDCGRNLIHPNIWVNALMSEYKKSDWTGGLTEGIYPNWIVTDIRFPNEVKAIKDRGGLIFRIESNRIQSTDLHESETALNNYTEWDDIIYNHSTIEKLIDTMQQVLKSFKIINNG